MGHGHVQYVKINYVICSYSMEGKCLSLIVIVVFSHETMHSGEIDAFLLRGEPCMGNLHST